MIHVIRGIFNLCVFLSPFVVFMFVVRDNDNFMVSKDATATTTERSK